jgi:hypothetical protein
VLPNYVDPKDINRMKRYIFFEDETCSLIEGEDIVPSDIDPRNTTCEEET